MKVVAEVEVLGIIEDNPDSIWDVTSEFAGISKRFFDSYYEGKHKAVAYHLGNVTEYKSPKPLIDYGINYAPQSFVYI